MGQGYFITGTDTECGKTEVTLGLMARLQAKGKRVVGMKPVASGATNSSQGLLNEDARRLQEQSSFDPEYRLLNRYVFEPPIAPHLAARQAGVTIELPLIRDDFMALQRNSDLVVVEGVGGWRVPLNQRQSVADLALALGLPVILVVGLRLGCINHALLSAESIVACGADLCGWVANRVDPDMLWTEENIATLQRMMGAPLLGRVPHLQPVTAAAAAACLQLPVR